jgi:signal transduction histidine kinase
LEQTRRDYVANVSHELRTPISSIRSLAETLNDGLVKQEEDRSRYYGYILRESLRLTRLINDLLELSAAVRRGCLKRARFLSTACGRSHRANAARRILQRHPHSGGLALRPPLTVRSNRDRIEQVMIALVDNAIKLLATTARLFWMFR